MDHTKSYQLEDIEIVGCSSSGAGGRKIPLSKSSRKSELIYETVDLLHVPSGISGSVDIDPGYYSKKEMQNARENTKLVFLSQLKTNAVNRELP